MRNKLGVLAVFVGSMATLPFVSEAGTYDNDIVAQFLPDGRHMVIIKAFTYVDDEKVSWPIPFGTVVDGASIPRPLWATIGGPFEGKYRSASVIHDLYCDRRVRPWKQVDHMFYNAMIDSGVDEVQAKILYAGVAIGGPRWDDQAIANNGPMPSITLITPDEEKKIIEDLKQRFPAKRSGIFGGLLGTFSSIGRKDFYSQPTGEVVDAPQGPYKSPEYTQLKNEIAQKHLSLDEIDKQVSGIRNKTYNGEIK